VSLVLALSLPREQIQWSGWVYFSMIILVPLHRYYLELRIRDAQKIRKKQAAFSNPGP
jgi:hypothetical protein